MFQRLWQVPPLEGSGLTNLCPKSLNSYHASAVLTAVYGNKRRFFLGVPLNRGTVDNGMLQDQAV